MNKPDKIYLDNTNLAYAFSDKRTKELCVKHLF